MGYHKFRYNNIPTTFILKDPEIHPEGLYSKYTCKTLNMQFTKGTGFFPFLNMAYYKKMPKTYQPEKPKK